MSWIKSKRKELHMNQTELAKLSRVTQQTISFYEDGITHPRPKMIVRMLAILGYRIVEHGSSPGMIIIEELQEERKNELLEYYKAFDY